jgi:hypothetical protein
MDTWIKRVNSIIFNKLTEWQNAPFASYCHPREEHLLHLHVCAGLSNLNATLIFDDTVFDKRTCGFLWND